MKTVGYIGGGRITRILLQGFKNANITFDKVFIYDPNIQTLESLKRDFNTIICSTTDHRNAAAADIVFLALHPPVLMENIQRISEYAVENSLIVSLAPKITMEKLKTAFSCTKNLARMNPNAGTFVNKGYNPVCFSDTTEQNIRNEFITLFEKLGKIPVVPEELIETYAVISAMGYTYFWFQLEELKVLAKSFGLTEEDAQETISSMLQGTIYTLFNSGMTFQEVSDLVPVKPMLEYENNIREMYQNSLNAMFNKIRPQ